MPPPGPSVWMYAIHDWFEKVIYGAVLAGAELFKQVLLTYHHRLGVKFYSYSFSYSSNEWWRWPRQSGRARKDKSLFHTAASIYWCCPQRDGSLANASFWWHWGCFWFFFIYLGNASGENWTEKLSNFVCALFFVCVFVLISSFLGFCLLWALAPILLILVGTPRSCGFGQRRICLSSLCSNTYYWEWTRPGDQGRSYLEIWTYFHNSTGRFFWLRFSCMFNVISNCKDSMKKKPFSFLWFHSLYLAKKKVSVAISDICKFWYTTAL